MSEQNQIEITIEEAEKSIAMSECLERLAQSKDFQQLILEDYFKTNSVRLVSLRADPNFNSKPENVVANNRALDGISELMGYFRTVSIMGGISRQTLADHIELENQED